MKNTEPDSDDRDSDVDISDSSDFNILDKLADDLTDPELQLASLVANNEEGRELSEEEYNRYRTVRLHKLQQQGPHRKFWCTKGVSLFGAMYALANPVNSLGSGLDEPSVSDPVVNEVLSGLLADTVIPGVDDDDDDYENQAPPTPTHDHSVLPMPPPPAQGHHFSMQQPQMMPQYNYYPPQHQMMQGPPMAPHMPYPSYQQHMAQQQQQQQQQHYRSGPGAGQGRPPPASGGSEVCRYFSSPGGCSRGESCRYIHDKSGGGGATGGGLGRGSPICRFFNSPGGCARGDSCRFLHAPR
mmetsp:Transcript_41460/g.67273  ORF Transcript_41460/g.67273 Transcript_41460/m.67273 type:complete len:298 (-) Transcript_41460:105-998(-)